MSYYDPYYMGTPRSRRLSYSSTPASFSGVPLSPYHEPMVHSYSQPAYSQSAYSQPAYSMYASSNMSNPYLPYTPYDDVSIRDPYYPNAPLTHPMRSRRSSSVSYASMDPLRSRGYGRLLKFKRKGAFQTGITIGEAQANVRLSGSDSYTFKDLGVDARGKIYVNLRWPGYPPLNYEIPIDGYGGYVDVQSLARRVGRGVSHYLQANVIPIRWDRIEMQYLEELSIGMWHLKMSAQ